MDIKDHGRVFFLTASENKYREVGERSIGINHKDCLFFFKKKLVGN